MKALVFVLVLVAGANLANAGARSCKRGDFKACAAACAKKDGESCKHLGHMYTRRDKGAPTPDDAKGLRAYQDGCTYKFGEACGYAVAMATDPKVSIRYFEKGCALKHGGSCISLGGMYYEGTNVPKDGNKAVPYFEKACTYGESGGCINLGMMEVQGDGIKAAPARGLKRLIAICDKGVGRGCTEAGVAWFKGEAGSVDKVKAHALFVRACAAKESDQHGCQLAASAK